MTVRFYSVVWCENTSSWGKGLCLGGWLLLQSREAAKLCLRLWRPATQAPPPCPPAAHNPHTCRAPAAGNQALHPTPMPSHLNHQPAPPPATLSAAHLLEAAKQRLGSGGSGRKGLPQEHKAVNFYQAGIEQHQPEQGRYDVIWLQWAALYLTDGEGRLGWAGQRWLGGWAAGWAVICASFPAGACVAQLPSSPPLSPHTSPHKPAEEVVSFLLAFRYGRPAPPTIQTFNLPSPPLPHTHPPTPAEDLVSFLQRSAAALRPGGMLFVKENVCDKGFVVDNSDASVTRCALVWGQGPGVWHG